jgi:hypothetical protein
MVREAVKPLPLAVTGDVWVGVKNHFAGRKSVRRDDFVEWLNEAIDIAQGRAQ